MIYIEAMICDKMRWRKIGAQENTNSLTRRLISELAEKNENQSTTQQINWLGLFLKCNEENENK